jgi:multidrug resistance efflux pump
MPKKKIEPAFHYLSLGIALLALLVVLAASLIFAAFFRVESQADGIGVLLIKGAIDRVTSPRDGTISDCFYEEGDFVKKGSVIALLQSFKAEEKIEIIAHADGLIAEISAYPGSFVSQGETVAIMTEQGDPRKDLELTGFVSSLVGKRLKPGMPVKIRPSITNARSDGELLGVLKSVAKLPASKAAILSLLKVPELAKFIQKKIEAEPFLVMISLTQDDAHESGYAWTGPGLKNILDSGVIAEFSVTFAKERLLAFLWPSFYRLFIREQ